MNRGVQPVVSGDENLVDSWIERGLVRMPSQEEIDDYLEDNPPQQPGGGAGPPGPQGPQGDTGDTGPAGNDGAQGPQGDTGDTGPAGNDGAQGLQGATGNTGPAGNDGAQGLQGTAGAGWQAGGNPNDVVNFSNVLIDVVSKSLSLVAGDTIRFELFGRINNATGGIRTWTLAIVVGSKILEVTGSTTVATATDTPVHIIGYAGIRSTSIAELSAMATLNPVAANGASSTDVARSAWSTSASNLTGTQACKIQVRSGTSGNGATLKVAGWSIAKINL